MKAVLGLLSIAASIYVLLALTLYLLQGKMVFLSNMPGRALTASPGDLVTKLWDPSAFVWSRRLGVGWRAWWFAGCCLTGFVGVALPPPLLDPFPALLRPPCWCDLLIPFQNEIARVG